MLFIYNILFVFLFLLTLPYFILKIIFQNKYRSGLAERFGFISREKMIEGKVIWIHAVSVGEASAVYPLYKALKEKHPALKVIFSTTTKTGQEWIKTRLYPKDISIYFPLDIYWIVKRVLNTIRPQTIIIAETEIWPNFWILAHQKNIPLSLINARMSKRSFNRYLKIKFFLKPVLKAVSFVSCQTQEDARCYERLGVQKERIFVGGNLKFEILIQDADQLEKVSKLKQKLNVKDDPILMGGSTHAGEEEILLNCFGALKKDFPKLRLILAPRHPERFSEVEVCIRKRGFPCLRQSQEDVPEWFSHTIFLIDSMGKLPLYYALATVVFMGKSLTAHGGQNLLEPAAWGKTILFGPNMENFKTVANEFLSHKAAIEVKNAEELEASLKNILMSQQLRENFEQKSKWIVQKNKGALAFNLKLISAQL